MERDSSLSADISLILRDYVNALRRFIVEDTELKEIARQLYFRHKDAFDFIFQVRPQPGDLVEPLRALVEISPEFVVDRPGPGRYDASKKQLLAKRQQGREALTLCSWYLLSAH